MSDRDVIALNRSPHREDGDREVGWWSYLAIVQRGSFERIGTAIEGFRDAMGSGGPGDGWLRERVTAHAMGDVEKPTAALDLEIQDDIAIYMVAAYVVWLEEEVRVERVRTEEWVAAGGRGKLEEFTEADVQLLTAAIGSWVWTMGKDVELPSQEEMARGIEDEDVKALVALQAKIAARVK